MSTPVALRCVLSALAAFILVALVLSGLIGGAMESGSDGQYAAIGLAAVLAPLAATVVGAWQARAAGSTRPALGILVAAITALVLGLLLFATNDTQSDSFDVVQVVLVPLGVIIGAGFYGTRWFGSTTSR